jgi:hypothetical protein
MRIVELLNAITVPVTNEEWDVLEKFNTNDIVLKEKLDPRDQLIANNLIKKDILSRRKNDDGQIYFVKKIR